MYTKKLNKKSMIKIGAGSVIFVFIAALLIFILPLFSSAPLEKEAYVLG
jgi:flagellar basal body-associated protein FliL